MLCIQPGVVAPKRASSQCDRFVWLSCRYPAYGALYTALEVLALPAVPLTMTAGLLFGVGPGAAVVSVSATIAATISFLIARYAGEVLSGSGSPIPGVDQRYLRFGVKGSNFSFNSCAAAISSVLMHCISMQSIRRRSCLVGHVMAGRMCCLALPG